MTSSIRKVLSEETQAGSDALMVTGIAMAMIGILAALAPLASGIVFDLLVGAAFIGAGVVELADAVRSARWQRSVLVALIGFVTFASGVVYVLHPVLGMTALTAIFIGYLVASGAFRMMVAFQLPSGVSGRFWTFLSGAVGLVLAPVAMSRTPITSMWLIGMFVGATLFSGGIARISLARGLRWAAERGRAPAEPVRRLGVAG